MNSRVAPVRTAGGLDRVDRAVQLLEDEWRRHGDVQLHSLWTEQLRSEAGDPEESVGVLAALVKADLRQRYDQGQTPAVSGYLERFPELRGAHSQVLSLVYEEFCLSEERGRAPDVEAFCERYPEWKSSLASQLRYHRLFGQAAGGNPPLPRFPEPGETFEEFQLLSLLGEGGTSRVFLAKNLSLGGKQVALKVTLDRGQEPNAQGALDHPHIVPVHSVTYQLKGSLCGLSMPYQPGLPLDQVITIVKPAERPRNALALWDVLFSDSAIAAQPAGAPVWDSAADKSERHRLGPRGDGWDGFPARGTYAQGVAWFGKIVARALQHAHSKKTYHRDVKPANILLTVANGPQLLDFNLAESPHSVAHARAALHGGTLPYMAPEQIEAFLNPDLWNQVEARADVYSLGLVLHELLTGQAPPLPAKALSPARAMRDLLDRRLTLDVNVRGFNPAIPHALQAIVAKCLAISPDDRYPDAESLAQELECFLKHQPLVRAVNPSRRERAGNWVVRNRRSLGTAASIPAFLLVVCAIWASGALSSRRISATWKPGLETSAPMRSAIRDIEAGAYDQAIRALSDLERKDPHSPIIKLYHAFALSECQQIQTDADKKKQMQREADKAVRGAVALADVDARVLDWAKNHAEVATHLVNFADAAITCADESAQKYDTANTKEKIERDSELREPAYEVASRALLLAEEIDSGSRLMKRLLATTEEFCGKYSEAYGRLSGLIESPSPDDSMDMQFFCRKLRGRVTCLWVDRDLQDKQIRADEHTRKRLDEAREDLRFCDRFLGPQHFDDQGIKEYYVFFDIAKAELLLAEVEMGRSVTVPGDEPLKNANRHLNAAKSFIDRSDSRAAVLDVPKPDDLLERWKHGRKELQKLQLIANNRPDNQVPSQSTVAVHPG